MPHLYTHRVRYRECDPMGVVYHTHVLDWFEAARTEALRDMGLPYREVEASGIITPVIEVGIRYHSPVRYDDVVEIETTFEGLDGVRVPIDYAVRRQAEPKVLISGRVLLCVVDAERGRPTSPPQALIDALARA